LHQLFLNITTLPEYKKYQPKIHSMPKSEMEVSDTSVNDDIKDGPWVVTLDNFLTDDECDRLIGLGRDRGYERSADVGAQKFDGTFDSFQNDGRTSHNTWCQDACYDDPTTKSVLNKIENLTGIPDPNSEYLQLLQYDVGQYYRTHHDYIEHQQERAEGVRILTVFLYLNDVEEGGGTDFPRLGITVQPKKGRALIWPSVLNDDPNKKDRRTDHHSLPVKQGIKYGANAWIHQRDFKEALERGCH
jgi:prolyl 4-hydroxylase